MKLFRLDRDVALVTGASVWQSCRRRGTFSPSLLPLNGMHTVVEVLKTAANGTFASSRMDVTISCSAHGKSHRLCRKRARPAWSDELRHPVIWVTHRAVHPGRDGW